MKLAYLSNSPLELQPANAVHVVNMCSAFALHGHDVVLYARCRRAFSKERVCSRFGVVGGFELRGVGFRQLKWIGAPIYGVIQGVRCALVFRPDLAYARCAFSAAVAMVLGVRTVFEFHEVPTNPFLLRLYRWMLKHRRFVRAVVISKGLQEDMCALFAREAPFVDWLVAHDGANEQSRSCSSFPLRRAGSLQIGYAGGLRSGNGIALILEIARRLPTHTFHVLGGQSIEIEEWRSLVRSDNVVWYGRRPPREVAAFLAECDILLAPYTEGPKTAAGKDTSRWMSPLKIFEYMASGRPMIVSDLPVLREVLSSDSAVLVPHADTEAWVAAISELENGDRRRAIGAAARRLLVQEYTWRARASFVLKGLG